MSDSVYRRFTIGWQAYDELLWALQDGKIRYNETKNLEKRYHAYQHASCTQCFCYMIQDENPFYACQCCNGTCEMQRHLRLARFKLEDYHLVAEEYLKMVIMGECGEYLEIIDTAIYIEGQRPNLETKELDVDIPLSPEKREEIDRFLALKTWEERRSFKWVHYKPSNK